MARGMTGMSSSYVDVAEPERETLIPLFYEEEEDTFSRDFIVGTSKVSLVRIVRF